MRFKYSKVNGATIGGAFPEMRQIYLHKFLPIRGWLYFRLFAACVKAEAATLFWAGVDLGFAKILAALEATAGDVFSLLLFGVFMLHTFSKSFN
jgi:hypothetical protein